MSKLTVDKAINKCFILFGIKPQEKTPIYYKSYLETLTDKITMVYPCVVVDYEHEKREWRINYLTVGKIYSCTIDDITGTGYISSF